MGYPVPSLVSSVILRWSTLTRSDLIGNRIGSGGCTAASMQPTQPLNRTSEVDKTTQLKTESELRVNDSQLPFAQRNFLGMFRSVIFTVIYIPYFAIMQQQHNINIITLI